MESTGKISPARCAAVLDRIDARLLKRYQRVNAPGLAWLPADLRRYRVGCDRRAHAARLMHLHGIDAGVRRNARRKD